MIDAELDAIRRKKFRKLQRRLAISERKTEETDANEVLNRIFKGRAWEVFDSASYQFPHHMSEVKNALVKLATSGRLNTVNGEQLYLFLKKLGLRVRLDTKIKFSGHGQLKSLAEKLKEDLQM